MLLAVIAGLALAFVLGLAAGLSLSRVPSRTVTASTVPPHVVVWHRDGLVH